MSDIIITIKAKKVNIFGETVDRITITVTTNDQPTKESIEYASSLALATLTNDEAGTWEIDSNTYCDVDALEIIPD